MSHNPVPPPINPTQILGALLRTATASFQLQQEQIRLLKELNAHLKAQSRTDKTENLPAPAAVPTLKGGGLLLVKIENANIPFLAAVGLMVKLALASLPAAIIVGIIWFGLALITGPWLSSGLMVLLSLLTRAGR